MHRIKKKVRILGCTAHHLLIDYFLFIVDLILDVIFHRIARRIQLKNYVLTLHVNSTSQCSFKLLLLLCIAWQKLNRNVFYIYILFNLSFCCANISFFTFRLSLMATETNSLDCCPEKFIAEMSNIRAHRKSAIYKF